MAKGTNFFSLGSGSATKDAGIALASGRTTLSPQRSTLVVAAIGPVEKTTGFHGPDPDGMPTAFTRFVAKSSKCGPRKFNCGPWIGDGTGLHRNLCIVEVPGLVFVWSAG